MTSDHTDTPNPPPSRRSFLALAGAAPLVASVPASAAVEPPAGFTFYAVLWDDHGGLVGVGRTEAEAWDLAHHEILQSSLDGAEHDPESWPDPEGAAAETFETCRAEGTCIRVEAADEAAGYAAAGMCCAFVPRITIRIWRAAFPAPIDGPDAFAIAVEEGEAAGRRREEERKAERDAHDARAREEGERRRAEREAQPKSADDLRAEALGDAFAGLFRALRDGRVSNEALLACGAAIAAGRPAVLDVAGA